MSQDLVLSIITSRGQWINQVCVCDAMLLILSILFTLQEEAKPDPTMVPSTKWIAGDGQAIRIIIVA